MCWLGGWEGREEARGKARQVFPDCKNSCLVNNINPQDFKHTSKFASLESKLRKERKEGRKEGRERGKEGGRGGRKEKGGSGEKVKRTCSSQVQFQEMGTGIHAVHIHT